MRRQWDVIVIGAGAAGLSAARSVAKEGLSCACIDRMGPGGLLMNIGTLYDSPEAALESAPETTMSETTGADLAAELLTEAVEAGVELVFGEVRTLAGPAPWVVKTDDEEHEAKVVIIAIGLSAGTLGVANEQSYEGRGLSHCASCDGPFFTGRNVVVAGNDRWTLREAGELAGIAGQVTLVGEPGGGAEALAPAERVKRVQGRVTALKGADGLETVVVTHDGVEGEIEAHGVFVYLDRQPVLDFAEGLIRTDPADRIIVDDSSLACVPFLFAAGDVRAGSAETASGAILDGQVSGLAAAHLLKRHDVSQPDTG